jgi:tetratricopeptide (TPR) repeat protein
MNDAAPRFSLRKSSSELHHSTFPGELGPPGRDGEASRWPQQIDSREWPTIAARLQELNTEEVTRSPELAFVLGRLHVMQGRPNEALPCLSRALSLRPGNSALTARIAFELGCLHLSAGNLVAAETTLTYAESLVRDGGRSMPDLLHLRALIAETRGRPARALGLYRAAIRNSSRSFSPLTVVLALRNLAAGLAHSEPTESVRLIEFASDVLDSSQLNTGLRPTLLNVRCYALTCLGQLQDAISCGSHAAALANEVGNVRTNLHARFNVAIARELQGEVDTSRNDLEIMRGDAVAHGYDDIAKWADVRLTWLDYVQRTALEAETRLTSLLHGTVEAHFRRSLDTLRALVVHARSHDGRIEQDLLSLASAYEGEADAATALVLHLWRSWILRGIGRTVAARAALRRAYAIGNGRSFRLSPNWWHPAIVQSAREIADGKNAEYLQSLYMPKMHGAARVAPYPPVRIGHTGLLIDGRPLSDERWREGRAGAHVLQRYFHILSESHGTPVPRDSLIDALWPDSDGDRAIGNLHGATRDLRRVLASVPGICLVVEDGCYELRAEGNVLFEEHRRPTERR